MTMLINKTLRLFLESIGRQEEYEYYLERFRTDQRPAFAILCLEDLEMAETASFFHFDLNFLLRLGLYPVILLCGEGAKVVKKRLMTGNDAYTSLEIEKTSDGNQSQFVDFVNSCRKEEKIAVLEAEGRDLKDALLLVIPTLSKRVHIIRSRGPLRNSQGERLTFYYTTRPNSIELDKEDEPTVKLAGTILEERPGVHISVTSPWDLLRELFTIKGAGCVIRRGVKILKLTTADERDESRIANLLERSFGRQLRGRHCIEKADLIYVDENYYGAALLQRQEYGMYLSKFAVDTEARGEGLANELWREISQQHPAIFWRARLSNPINQWYEKLADGYYKDSYWRIYWRGLPWQNLAPVINYALNQENDFI